MSKFAVKVTTEDGTVHAFDEPASNSGDAYEAAAARFGYLCAVSVLPK